MRLGHQACVGGKGTCEGTGEERGAEGLATAVESVMDGAVALLRGPWGKARTPCNKADANTAAVSCISTSKSSVDGGSTRPRLV